MYIIDKKVDNQGNSSNYENEENERKKRADLLAGAATRRLSNTHTNKPVNNITN